MGEEIKCPDCGATLGGFTDDYAEIHYVWECSADFTECGFYLSSKDNKAITRVSPKSMESTVESAMEPTVIDVDELTRDIAGVLNKHCYENLSDTPDFILAEYVVECLRAWNGASTRREKWYGYKHSPGQGGPTPMGADHLLF